MANNGEADLETLLGYSFNEPEILELVVARKGASDGRASRKAKDAGLAVLGDAVMSCVVVNHFYSQGMNPEDIGREKASRVCRDNCARIAEQIGLGDRLMPAKKASAGELHGSALGERFEEIMGAVYLDDINAGGTGIGACWEVLKHVGMI